jgi:hypothetical protein
MLFPPVAVFPTGCWTYLSFTQVMTCKKISLLKRSKSGTQSTCAFSLDHQLRGITRMLGIAASAAGAPERISLDCTHRAGTERAKDDCIWESSKVWGILTVGLTCVKGIPRSLNCCSTFMKATRALFEDQTC